MSAKKDAVATFKTCPKCHGTGRVTSDGKDHIRQKYLAWAWRLHMKPVVYAGKQEVPGIAVAGINPGGWAFLDIYVSLATEVRGDWGIGRFNEEVGTYLYVKRRRKRGKKLAFQNFYCIEVRGPEGDKVKLLDIWPQHLLSLPGSYELEGEESLRLLETVKR